MADRPSVSILIDCYNHEAYVAATIESALAQTWPEVEVIVVDDGSPDGSQRVIAGFGDAVQTIFQDNQGQIAACTNAFMRSKGEIVFILDSDDLLVPEAVAEVARLWRPGIAKVQFQLETIDAAGRSLHNVFPKYPQDFTPAQAREALFRTGSYPDAPTSGNAWSRRFLEAVLPLQGPVTRNGIDGLLSGVAPLHGEVVTLPRRLGMYRLHDANDYSQNSLALHKFGAYVAHSEARVRFIRHACKEQGLELAEDVLARDIKHQEFCLVAEKFLAADSGRKRRLLPVAWRALGAAAGSSHDPWQRLLRSAWVAVVALAPKPLAKRIVAERYVVGGRWRFTESVLNLGRKLLGRSRTPQPDGIAAPGR